MLGLGETRQEIRQTLYDLRSVGCDLITLGQYLAPSKKHHPIARFVPPQEFEEIKVEAEDRGFKGVASSPLVRSSYRAGQLYRQVIQGQTG
jgi:lipoic acid synthetase